MTQTQSVRLQLVVIGLSVLLSQIDTSPAFGETPFAAQKSGPATMLVDKQVDKDAIALGLADFLAITIQVDGSNSLEVRTPSPISQSKGWRLVRTSAAAVTAVGNNQRRWTQSIALEPMLPGELALQIEPLETRDGEEVFRKLYWMPMTVHVTASLVEPDLKSLRDPTVIEPPPPAEPASEAWIWAIAGLFVASALTIAVVSWRRRARPRPLSAEQCALRQLDRLHALGLVEQGKSAGFHRLLVNIVRRYLDRKLDLRARHQTTPEFLGTLQSSQKLSSSQQTFLRDFFQACDLAKFAGANVAAKDEAAFVEGIRGFIRASAG